MAETKVNDNLLVKTVEQQIPITREKLLSDKAALEAQLAEVNRLIAVLDSED